MHQPLRILLIAGDPEVIRRVGEGLRRHGADETLIEGADSMATARRRLGSGFYDLAVADMALGGSSDGLHVLSQLHALAPDLPVVALSTGAEDPGVEACLALGAVDRLGREALDADGLLDRLHAATARGRAGLAARRRSERVARSLAASGDLAWYFESGEGEVWLATPDPGAWGLPAPEWRESLDSVKGRIHPDDRELVLRQLEDAIAAPEAWYLEARFKMDEAYRWVGLRGQAHRDDRGRVEYVAGVLSDAQNHQKRLRELEQNRRFLRALFDSTRVPQAVIDASAVITDCNPAWLALEDPACHAGTAFLPGRRFVEKSASVQAGDFGDLDVGELGRGVRQVLGGVAEQFACEYGKGARRWRILVAPLLNPGIAGAVVSHEEITAERREASAQLARLKTLERDLRAVPGPLFRLAPDFSIRAVNEEGEALGRPPLVGRDILKVLPRQDANAVGDALATIAAGAASAIRDSRSTDGKVLRWLLTALRNADGSGQGILVHAIEVSDLAAARAPVDSPFAAADEHEARSAAAEYDEELRIALAEAERAVAEERASRCLAEGDREALLAELHAERAMRAGLAEALETESSQRADLAKALDAELAARVALGGALDAEKARGATLAEALEAERVERIALAQALEAERCRHAETLAALTAAGMAPAQLRADLDQAKQGLRTRIDELLERVFEPLLVLPEPAAPPSFEPVMRHDDEAK
jgi:CheY-like chemotaxis protein